MLRNYLLVAIRNLQKNKSYVIINTLGLGIAMSCCIAAYLVLAYNIEFDSHYSEDKVADIFKLHTASQDNAGIERLEAMAPLALAPTAAEELSGIKDYCRFVVTTGPIQVGDKVMNVEIDFADSTFFDMFDLPLKKGSQKSLKDKNSIFLSESVAKQFFGNEDPLGKMMLIGIGDGKSADIVVAGVLQDLPANNTFNLVTLMRIEKWLEWGSISQNDWKQWRESSTFFRLGSRVSASEVNQQLQRYVPIRNQSIDYSIVKSYALEPFLSEFDYDTVSGSYINMRLSTVPVFTVVAISLLILLIACFNLTNTSIAMTMTRLKEFGVRKVVGARAFQIAGQFLLETAIMVSIAIATGLLLAQFIVPAFMNMWQLPFKLEDLNGLNFVIALTAVLFIGAVLAGIYPALFSNRFKPTALIKGSAMVSGTNAFTKMLVSAQFALSVVVLVAGVASIQNAAFQEGISFGYDKDQIITVALQGDKDFEIMVKQLSSDPRIISIGASSGNLGENSYHTPVTVDASIFQSRVLAVGKNFFETMGLQVINGRALNLDNVSDMESVVVNRAFVSKTGLKEPIDKVVTLHGGPVRIVGVVENHVDDLFRSRDFEPFIFYAAPKDQYFSMLVKTSGGDLAGTQQSIEKIWKELFPMKPYESRFQEDVVMKKSRDRNKNSKTIFLFITLLGAVISASGIYALASMSISRRTKEIGVRKVLGATTSHIIRILNQEFVFILAAGGLFGAAGGYYFTRFLLNRLYAYHIELSLAVALTCGALIFIVGVSATTSSIVRAARANPVNTLRSE